MIILGISIINISSLPHLQPGKLVNVSLDPLKDTTEVILTQNDNAHAAAKVHASHGTGYASVFSGYGLKFTGRSVLMNLYHENINVATNTHKGDVMYLNSIHTVWRCGHRTDTMQTKCQQHLH